MLMATWLKRGLKVRAHSVDLRDLGTNENLPGYLSVCQPLHGRDDLVERHVLRLDQHPKRQASAREQLQCRPEPLCVVVVGADQGLFQDDDPVVVDPRHGAPRADEYEGACIVELVQRAFRLHLRVPSTRTRPNRHR